jgi:gluconokinase
MTALVVMGVSGCGKSHVGAAVAHALGWPLVEGDEFHSEANRARMRDGIPLTDAHRAAWLDQLGRELQAHPAGAVLTCSALKRAYRERLRAASPGLRFAWLDLGPEAAQQRVARRASHFFPPSLVDNQFATLEPPLGEPGVLQVDALDPPDALARRIADWVRSGAS